MNFPGDRSKIFFLIPALLSLAMPLGGPAAGEDDYVIPVLPGATSASIIESYLTGPPAWGVVVDYNRLLRPGAVIRVPAALVNLEGKAYVSTRYGETHVRLEGEEQWREAVPGLIIQRGDTLRAGPHSGIELTMENGDRAVLREQTTVEFLPIREREKTNLLRVIRGRVISIIGQEAPRDIRYQIQTPTAVSLVRGTRFRTKVDQDDRTVFEVLEGNINVRAEDEELDLESDFGVRI